MNKLFRFLMSIAFFISVQNSIIYSGLSNFKSCIEGVLSIANIYLEQKSAGLVSFDTNSAEFEQIAKSCNESLAKESSLIEKMTIKELTEHLGQSISKEDVRLKKDDPFYVISALERLINMCSENDYKVSVNSKDSTLKNGDVSILESHVHYLDLLKTEAKALGSKIYLMIESLFNTSEFNKDLLNYLSIYLGKCEMHKEAIGSYCSSKTVNGYPPFPNIMKVEKDYKQFPLYLKLVDAKDKSKNKLESGDFLSSNAAKNLNEVFINKGIKFGETEEEEE